MATPSDTKSLSDLEQEAEATREDLINTVDSLHSRVSPRAIKSDLEDYARDTGQQLLRKLERRVRENPLQTAAVAAGLAYPVWRLLTNMPAPVLLVGAGIALSRRGSSGTSTFRSGAASSGGSFMQDVTSVASRGAESLTKKVADVIGEAKSKTEDLRTWATESASQRTNAARGMASEAVASAADTLSGTYQSGVKTAADAARQASDTLSRTTDSLMGTIETHPLVVGGIGLIIGGLIASALPVTQVENQVLGATSRQVKDRVGDLASDGVQAVKTAAGEVYDAAASQANDHGLGADLGSDTVRNLAEKLKAATRTEDETGDL